LTDQSFDIHSQNTIVWHPIDWRDVEKYAFEDNKISGEEDKGMLTI